MNGDQVGSHRAMKMLREAFAQGTLLHRELTIARQLLSTKMPNENAAVRTLAEARTSVTKIDRFALNAEKSKLIERVANELDDTGSLYEAQLADYKLMSTVGTLFHDWCESRSDDVTRVALYESMLIERMTASKIETPSAEPEPTMSVGERRAVISLMSRKLDERWSEKLSVEQRSLLKEYAAAKDSAPVLAKLRELRETTLACLDACESMQGGSKYFLERLEETRQAVRSRTIDEVTDETVALGMLYLDLVREASEESV